jgi:hypothetical protein
LEHRDCSWILLFRNTNIIKYIQYSGQGEKDFHIMPMRNSVFHLEKCSGNRPSH